MIFYMSGSRYKSAGFVLWDVGFAESPEEAESIIENQTVLIDGEHITDSGHQRVYFNGRKYLVEVDDETAYYRAY